MVGNFGVAQNMVGNLWWGILIKTPSLSLFVFLFLSLPPPFSSPLFLSPSPVLPPCFFTQCLTDYLRNHGGEFMVGNFGAPRIMVGNLGIPTMHGGDFMLSSGIIR